MPDSSIIYTPESTIGRTVVTQSVSIANVGETAIQGCPDVILIIFVERQNGIVLKNVGGREMVEDVSVGIDLIYTAKLRTQIISVPFGGIDGAVQFLPSQLSREGEVPRDKVLLIVDIDCTGGSAYQITVGIVG